MSFDLEKEEQKYRKYKADKAAQKESVSEAPSDKGNADVASHRMPVADSSFSETPYRPVLRMFSWSSALIGMFAYLFHRNQMERKKWHRNGILFFLTIGLLNVGFGFITQPGDTMTHIVESDTGWIILDVFLAFFVCRNIRSNGIRIVSTIVAWLVIQFMVSFIRGKIGFEVFEDGALYWLSLGLNFVVVGFVGQRLFNKMQNPDLVGTQQLDDLWKSRERKAVITGVVAWCLIFAFYFGVGVGAASVPSNEPLNEVEDNLSSNQQTYLLEFGIVCEDAQGVVAPDTLDDIDQILYLHNQIILKCGANQIIDKKTFDYYHLSEYTARFPQVAPSVKKYGAILYTYETQSGNLAYIFAYKKDEPDEASDTLVIHLENEDLEKYDFLALCSNKPGLFINMANQRRVMDCAKYLAAEIVPTLVTYKLLQEAYFAESGRLGNWAEIGMTSPTDTFFQFVESLNGIKVVVPKDIRQCSAESSWLYQAEKVDNEIKFDIIEPKNELCRDMFDVNKLKSR